MNALEDQAFYLRESLSVTWHECLTMPWSYRQRLIDRHEDLERRRARR